LVRALELAPTGAFFFTLRRAFQPNPALTMPAFLPINTPARRRIRMTPGDFTL